MKVVQIAWTDPRFEPSTINTLGTEEQRQRVERLLNHHLPGMAESVKLVPWDGKQSCER